MNSGRCCSAVGVPMSNFLGWYLTVYIFCQSFVLYLRGRSTDPHPLPSSYWQLAVLFYGVSAAGNFVSHSASRPLRGLRFYRGSVEGERHHWYLCRGFQVLCRGFHFHAGSIRFAGMAPTHKRPKRENRPSNIGNVPLNQRICHDLAANAALQPLGREVRPNGLNEFWFRYSPVPRG